MARSLFFATSRQTFDQVTGIFDFLWPTAAAMWNLRWQVDGYLAARPEAGEDELESRFVLGSGIHGANLRRACVAQSWDDQQAEFARFLLVNACALYESWLQATLESLSAAGREKQMQYPTFLKNGSREGVGAALDAITENESAMIRQVFYPGLTGHRKNSLGQLDNLLKCYRYFKECRNCLVHNGGLVSDAAERAYHEFAAVASGPALNLGEPPDHRPLVKGGTITVNLRGIVGFCDVILRLIATLDAELARSARAEKVFNRAWADAHGRRVALKTSDLAGRCRQIVRLTAALELPKPAAIETLDAYLSAHGLAA